MVKFKKVCCLLLCAVCVALAACAPSNNSQATPTEAQGVAPGTSKPQGAFQGDLHVSPNQISAHTYDDYLSLIQQRSLPEDFVEFSDQSYFGTFKAFYTGIPFGTYGYRYDFVDENGIELILFITYEPLITNIESLSDEDVKFSDMRTLTSKKSGRYTVNGFAYTYLKGNLSSISWSKDGLYYSLSPNEYIKYCPLNYATAFAKLLSIQNETYSLMYELLES